MVTETEKEEINYDGGAINTNTKATTTKNTSATSNSQLSPLVYWAQTEQQINLKVDLKDTKEEPHIDFSPKSLKFTAKGYGACGFNAYKFALNYYEEINEEECYYRVLDNKIEIILKKCNNNWWPRLVATPQKPHWLKIDFDRWRTEDDMLLEDDKPRDVMQDYSQAYNTLQKEEFGYIKENAKKVYMVFYNLAQFIGYLYILCVLGVLYTRDGSAAIAKAYVNVGSAMKFCQLMQYLEVLHPIFGYTKGGALMPFFQVSGRNFVLFIMIELEERMQTKPVIFYVFVIWSMVEIVRYPYYITQLLDVEVGFLSWLRYTIWIPLYPMGIVCEGIIILRNIVYFEETKRFTLEMPNKWNVTFDMPLFMKFYLFLLILPGTYMVMTHMAKVRAKKLGTLTTQHAKKHIN